MLTMRRHADDPYTLEQLREPRMNVLMVRPLVDRLYDPNDVSVGMYTSHSQILGIQRRREERSMSQECDVFLLVRI